MSSGESRQYLTVAVFSMAAFFSAVVAPAADWYWGNDAGGTWDEAFGDVTSWRDPSDNPGIPSTLDDALLVLPYSFSFCNPDGTCFVQPVVVWYRSETNPTLDEVIIESQNSLLQQEEGGISLDQLNLTSNVEIVGGSGRVFSPPPSYPLPDPPGIFPDGMHIQRAGTNTVNDHLVVGRVGGSVGRYELSGAAVLDVSGYEVIGDAGEGEFSQLGGTHTTGSLIVGQRIGSDGDFDLEDGSLGMTHGIIGAAGDGSVYQTGGTFEAEDVVLGRDASGRGDYHLAGGILSTHTLNAGEYGYGHFYQQSGTTLIRAGMRLGTREGGVGVLSLDGGDLTVGNLLSIGAEGEASIVQTGDDSVLTAHRVAMGSAASSLSRYYLRGGTLNVMTSLQIGPNEDVGPLYARAEASFVQSAGVHNVRDLQIGHIFNPFPASYNLEDGTLNAVTIEIQRRGAFEQSGGVNTVTERLELGYNCSYMLNGGTLNVGNASSSAELSFNGRISQVGASSRIFVYGNADVGDGGRYTLADGSFHVAGRLRIRGFLTIQDGDVNVGELRVEDGLAEMTGGRLVVQETFAVQTVRPIEEAIFHQTGGTVDVRGDLVLTRGDWQGLYTLADTGELNVDGTLLVAGENGLFNLFGGHLATSALDNRGDLQWIGGELVTSNILNEGSFTIDLHGSPLISTGPVENHGTFHFRSSLEMSVAVFENFGTVKLYDGVEVTFRGPFISAGGIESDPALARFTDDLEILEEGYLVGGTGDRFVVEGDFLNRSEQTSKWKTEDAALILGGSGRRTVQLPGEDRGDSPAARIDNFAWGTLEILEGVEVEFIDGNPNNGAAAIYVDVLDIKDRALIDPENRIALPFFGNADIYYNASLPENDYLGGLTYVFADGAGTLIAQVPEPATIWMIVGVLPLVWLAIRRRPIKPRVL